MSDRKLPTCVTSATFLGAGLFVGAFKNGHPFVYQGGVVRVRRQDLSDPADSDQDHQAWAIAMNTVVDQLVVLAARSDWELVDDAPLEFTGCRDAETGEWLLLWRVACLEVVTH